MDDDHMFEWMTFNELTHHVKYRFLDLRMQYYVWNKAVREGDWKESSTGVKMVLVRV